MFLAVSYQHKSKPHQFSTSLWEHIQLILNQTDKAVLLEPLSFAEGKSHPALTYSHALQPVQLFRSHTIKHANALSPIRLFSYGLFIKSWLHISCLQESKGHVLNVNSLRATLVWDLCSLREVLPLFIKKQMIDLLNWNTVILTC